MTRTLTNHSLFIRLGQALAFALLLGLASGVALAQGLPPNMTFADSANTRYTSSGTGVAFRGAVSGNVSGYIKNGAVERFDVRLDPDTNGPNNFRLLIIDYNRSAAVLPPTARWYSLSNGKKLVITNVPAKEYFSGTGVYSKGVATVEITFENNGPGRLVVSYRHQAFSSSGTQPRYFNGTVCDAKPQAAAKLYYTLLR